MFVVVRLEDGKKWMCVEKKERRKKCVVVDESQLKDEDPRKTFHTNFFPRHFLDIEKHFDQL